MEDTNDQAGPKSNEQAAGNGSASSSNLKRNKLDVNELMGKTKDELDRHKLAYEIIEKDKASKTFTVPSYLGSIFTFLTVLLSVISFAFTAYIQSANLRANNSIVGNSNLVHLITWITDSADSPRKNIAISQLKYYDANAIPIYFSILTDKTINQDPIVKDGLAYIIKTTDKKTQVLSNINLSFRSLIFDPIAEKRITETELTDLPALLKRVYNIFNGIDRESLGRDKLVIYSSQEILSASAVLAKMFPHNADAKCIEKVWLAYLNPTSK